MTVPSVYRYDPERKDDLAPREGLTAIYGLFDPDTLELRYIGKTIDPKMRIQAHKDHSKKVDARPLHRWTGTLRARGQLPLLRVLEWVANEDWHRAEREHLWRAKACGCDLLNASPGGGGGKVGPRATSPEERAARSERARRMWEDPTFRAHMIASLKHWWATITPEEKARHAERLRKNAHTPEANEKRRIAGTGRTHSPATRAKMSKAQMGKTFTAETRARMSAAQQAKAPASAESRAKMSKAQRGRRHSPESIAKMSEARRQLWQDPDYRARSIDSVTGVRKTPRS